MPARRAMPTLVLIASTIFSCGLAGMTAAQTEPEPTGVSLPGLNRTQADRLADLPLACLQQEYPNSLGQTLGSDADLASPSVLHPAFYGCFDWHSAVHGHWSLVALLRRFPELARADEARQMLADNLSAENIATEVAYFQGEHSKRYERTYGWAWLLKLASELDAWDDPLADELGSNLQPLANLIAERYRSFLPLLRYAVRTGEHPNTAFGLVFALDYAVAAGDRELAALIDSTARRFFLNDSDCPIDWEPGGYDFLSPCLEEIDLMRRVLPAEEFHPWLRAFLPALAQPGYTLAVGEVSDRSDGKLVHLDGVNFSRAWVLLGLARQYPERYAHLTDLAARHLNYSLPNLVGDTYEGGHWLGTFAIYALLNKDDETSRDEAAVVAALAQRFSARQAGARILFWNDRERRVGFKNLRHVYPTRLLPASSDPFPLGERPRALGGLSYSVDGDRFSVQDFLDHEASIGVIVVQAGNVVMEYYAPGNDEASPWVSFSVTKSVTSMLIGAAVHDGFIASVQEPVVNYLPRLRGSAYEEATIENVLHMASGVAWNEDYADPGSDVARAGALNGIELQRYLGELPPAQEPGTVFNYSTGETNLVGEILRSAIGNNASTYLNARIWQPFGMEHDATWATSGPGAGELGGCCISASLRDYARLGLFALAGGVLQDGTQVLPANWMDRSTSASAGDEGYGYLWWLYDDSYAARGIFGQQIRIDPARRLVIAVHSNAPAAVDTPYHAHLDAAIDAIRAAFPAE